MSIKELFIHLIVKIRMKEKNAKQKREILDVSLLLRTDFGTGFAQMNAHFLHAFGHFVSILRSIHQSILEGVQLSVQAGELRFDS